MTKLDDALARQQNRLQNIREKYGINIPTSQANINDNYNNNSVITNVDEVIAPTAYEQVNEYRSNSEILSDTVSTTGGGLASVGNQAVAIGATGVGLLEEVFTGDKNAVDNRVKASTQYTQGAVDYWNNNYSEVYKNKQAELQNIINNPNMSEKDKFIASIKFGIENPEMTADSALRSVINVGASTAIGGPALKLLGLGPVASQFIINSGIGAGSYINEESEQGKVTKETAVNALGYGLASGVINSGRGDVSGILLGRNTRQGLGNLFKDTVFEAGNELVDESLATVIHNKENNRELTHNLGGMAGTAMVTGGASRILANPVSTVTATYNTSKDLADKAGKVVQDRLDPYSYEVHGDINNEKFDPVRTVNELNSTINRDEVTEEEVKQAKLERAVLIKQVNNKVLDLQEQIDNAPTDAVKEQLQNELDTFESKYAVPLSETIKANDIALKQKHDEEVNDLMRKYDLAQQSTTAPQDMQTTADVNQTLLQPNSVTTVVKPTSQQVSLKVGGKNYTANLKNDGDGTGDYFEVATSKGKVKYYNYKEMGKEYHQPTNTLANNNLKFSGARSVTVNKLMGKDLQGLAQAFKQKTGMPLEVISGFRSYQDQQNNLNSKSNFNQDRFGANAWVGGSKHHTGLALDFFSVNNKFWGSKKGQTVFKALQELAPQYGFEMSYPEGNKGGVATEAWEFVYRGKDENTRVITAQLLAPKNSGVVNQSNQRKQNNTISLPDQKIRNADDLKSLNFKTPFVNVGSGNSLFSGSTVKGTTLEFMKILDADGLDGMMNAFTSITGGKHKNNSEISHGTGFKFDLDLKNGDDIETYAKVGNRVVELAKQHGYDVTVLAEKKGWGKIGQRGNVKFIDGGGSHLDIVVRGRIDSNQNQQNNVNTSNVKKSWQGKHHRDLTNKSDYDSIMSSTYSKYGFSLAEQQILKAQLAQESGLRNITKNNGAGAGGIAQFIDSTAKRFGINRFDVNQSIDGQARMMRGLLDKYNGDWAKALAAYNTGESNVDKHWGTDGRGKGGGVMTNAWSKGTGETLKYVENILANADKMTINGQGSSIANLSNQSEIPTDNSALDELNRQLNALSQEEQTEETQARITELEQQVAELQANGQTQQTAQDVTANITPEVLEADRAKIDNMLARASEYTAEQFKSILPIATPEQANRIHQMLQVKRDQADLNNTNQVELEINQGKRGATKLESNMGIDDYVKGFESAIQNNDLPTINKLSKNLARFASDKLGKAQAMEEALAYATGGKDVFIYPTVVNKRKQWQVAQGTFEKGDEYHKSGAFQLQNGLGSQGYQNTVNKIIREGYALDNLNNYYTSYITDLQNSGKLTKSQVGSNQSNITADRVNSIINNQPIIQETQVQPTAVTEPTPTQITTPNLDVSSTSNVATATVRSTNTKSIQPIENTNVSSVWYNKVKEYQRADNEVWVGNKFTTDQKGNLRIDPNSGIAGFTRDEVLADGTEARGKLFNADYFFQAGALGNPYSVMAKQESGFKVKDNKEAIERYIDLVKHFATSEKNNRNTFLEDLMQLRGKQLVTDEYHINEAKFLDYIVNQMPQEYVDAINNFNGTDNKQRNQVYKQARDWIESITPDITEKGKSKNGVPLYNATLSHANNITAEDLKEQRIQRMPFKNKPQTKQEKQIQVQEQVSKSIVETNFTDEQVYDEFGNVIHQEDLSDFYDGSFLTDDNIKEQQAQPQQPVQTQEQQIVSNGLVNRRANKKVNKAPEPMKARGNVKYDEENSEVNEPKLELDTKLDLIGSLDTLTELSNKDVAFTEQLKAVTFVLATHLNSPRLVVKEDTETSYNADENQVTLDSNDSLEDIARVLLQQSVHSVVDELALVDKVTIDGIQFEYDAIEDKNSTKAKELKQELDLYKKYYTVQQKIHVAEKAIRNYLANPNTKINKADRNNLIKLLDNPELLLSIGLTDETISGYLKQIKVPTKLLGKNKTSVYQYLVNTLKDFFGFGVQETNVLEALLSVVADITDINTDSNLPTENVGISALNVSVEYKQEQITKQRGKRNEFVVAFTQGKQTTLSKFNDVFSVLRDNPNKLITKVLTTHPTKQQMIQLEDFISFRDEFVVHLQASFVKGKQTYKDYKTYLYDEQTGTIDSNVLDALALSAYNWLGSNGNKAKNTFDDVKFLLNVDKDSDIAIPYNIYNQYKNIGFLLPLTAEEIGKNFTQILDIQETDNARTGSKAELEMSVGNWVISAMQMADLIETENMSGEQHADNITAVKGKIADALKGDSTIRFVKVTEEIEENGETYIQTKERVNEIYILAKGTQGFLNNLFGVEIGYRDVQYKKPEKVKTKIKKSKSIITKLQATFINKMQQESIEIDVPMFNVVDKLNSQFGSQFRQMIGAEITQAKLNKLHFMDRASKESKAEGLKRELDSGLGVISGLKRDKNGSFQKFWDYVYVARNNRMHFNSNLFNMQTSIIHRMLASYSNFKTTYDMKDVTLDALESLALDKGKPTKLGLFLRAMGANLEGTEDFIKTHVEKNTEHRLQAYTVDKMDSKLFIPAFVAWLKTDETQTAMKSMQKLIANKDFTQADMDIIDTFVNNGDMGVQSLRALVELANMMTAIQTKGTLTTAIGLGSDGVNNGIAIGSIYNGINKAKTLIQLGFIPKNNEWGITDYFSSRYIKVIGDYYEAYAQELKQVITDKTSNLQGQSLNVFNAIVALQPTIYGRKFAKAIIIPFGYSAGIGRLKQVAQETFVSDIRKKMTDLANKPDEKAFKEFETHLKIVLADGEFNLPQGKDLLEFWFNPQQESKIMQTYDDLIGESIDEALDKFAGDFAERRKQNVTMHEVTFSIFYDNYKAIVEKVTNDLIKDLGITADEFVERGFTNAEWKERVEKPLSEIIPRVATAFATTQGDIKLDESLEINDELATGIEVFKRATKFKPNKQNSTTNRNRDGNIQAISISLPAKEKMISEESAGVFVNSAQIQGTDGRISAEASAMLDGYVNLNIHDQNDSGLASYFSMVAKQNKVTFDVLATNHIQLNSLETLVDTLINLNTLLNVGVINQETYQNSLNKLLPKKAKKGIKPLDILSGIIDNVREIETTKIETLRNLYSVHQYAGELGHHVVTDNDIKLLEKEKSKIQKRIQNVRNTVAKLNGENTLSTQSQNILDNYTNGSQISIDLFNKLVNINPNQKITILNKANSDITDAGLYNPDTHQSKVVVDDDNWYATPLELINHELIHSVTADVIDSGKYNFEFDRLSDLVREVIINVNDDFITDRIMYATSNVNELLTVTLAENQIREVLPKDIIDDIEYLFNQIVGDFNANRPTKHQSRENARDSSQSVSENGSIQTTGQQSSGQAQSDDNNQRDAQSDEASIERGNETERLTDIINANIRPNQSKSRENVESSSRDVSDSNRENQSTQRVDRESQSSQNNNRNTSATQGDSFDTQNQSIKQRLTDVGINTATRITNGRTVINVQSNQGKVTHHVPSKLVDTKVNAKDAIQLIKSVTSKIASDNAKQYYQNMLNEFVTINPNVEFSFILDNQELEAEASINKPFITTTSGRTRDNQIYVNLNTPSVDTDLLETITHEYVHAMTNNTLDNPSDWFMNEMLNIQQVVKDYVGYYNMNPPRRLDYFLGNHPNGSNIGIREMLTLGLTNEPVSVLLTQIPYGNSTVFATLDNHLRQIINRGDNPNDGLSTREPNRTRARNEQTDVGSSSQRDGRDVQGQSTVSADEQGRVHETVRRDSQETQSVQQGQLPKQSIKQQGIKSLLDNLTALSGNATQVALTKYLTDKVLAVNHDLKLTFGVSDVLGRYFKQSNEIIIDKSKYGALTNDFARAGLVLHELLHSVTEQNFDNDGNILPNASKQAKQAFEKLDKLRLDLIKTGFAFDARGKYTTSNVPELMTMVMTDEEIQQRVIRYINDGLVEFKSRGGSPKATLASILDAVYTLFGFGKGDNSLGRKGFTEFVRLVDDLTAPISSPNQDISNLNQSRASEYTAQAVDEVNGLSAVEVLQSLPTQVSDKFNQHLDKLVQDIVGKFGEPQKLVQITSQKVNDKLALQFGLSEKESHTYEVLKAVFTEFLANQGGSIVHNDLHKIYDESYAQLTSDDFLAEPDNPTDLDKNLANQAYNRLFSARKDKDYLAEFLALSLSSERFNNILNKERQYIKRDIERPLFDRLMRLLDKVVNFFSGLYAHKTGKVNTQLNNLAKKLAKIDNNARNVKASMLDKSWELLGKGGSLASSYLIQKPATWGLSKLSSNTPVIGTAVSVAKISRQAQELGKTGLELTNETLSLLFKGKRYNEARNLVSEISNTSKAYHSVEEQVRFTQNAGQLRQRIKDNVRKALLSKFSNKGKNLEKKERHALTSMVMRTDIGSLLNHMNITSTLTMMTDTAKRQAKMNKLEQQILQYDNANDMLMQVKSLSAYMVRGVTPKHLDKNVEAIALRQATKNQTDKLDTKLVGLLDELITLYAIEYVDIDTRELFNQLVSRERKGIEAMIKAHQQYIKQSKDEFKDNPLNYIKGYTPDVMNPYRALEWIPDDADTIKAYENKGWVRVDDKDALAQDNLDKTDARVLMFHKDINYQRRVSGALDTVDTHSKGTVVYNSHDFTDLNRIANALLEQREERNQMGYQQYDPFSDVGNMVVNYGVDGYIIDYHYEMQGFVKDGLLERSNDIFDLMPTMASQLQFKPEIKQEQARLARILHADYMAEYPKNPNQFVIMSPESPDPKVRADFALMPYAFRQEAIKAFGKGNPIVVRASVYNAVFGYKAYSMGNMFEKVYGERNILEKMLTKMFTGLFGEKAQSRVVMMERLVQYIVGQAKDMIVIRSGKVLLGNIISNMLMLGMYGIRPDVVVRDMLFAWREGKKYGQWQNRVVEIDTLMLSAKPDEKTKLRQERATLIHDMNNSPMRVYMDSGMMSTIVEDTTILKDKQEYLSIYEEKINKLTGKIPDSIKTATDWLMLNPNTPVYQFLAEATQFSDFGAKYVLAKHLQGKGVGLTKAISEAQDTFINFDMPTGQGLDYLNRMGIVMFTKFFLRFQRVLSKMFMQKPAQMMAQHMGMEHLFSQAGILDPAMPLRIGNNPFEASAFSIFGASNDVLTMDVITGIW